MGLGQSIVEAAALAEPTATLGPALSEAETKQQVILELNPAIFEFHALATLRDAPAGGVAKLLRGKLSVAGATVCIEDERMIDIRSIADLELLRESVDVKCKLAAGRDGKGAVPEDFWATYSAFAHTQGELVVLGMREWFRFRQGYSTRDWEQMDVASSVYPAICQVEGRTVVYGSPYPGGMSRAERSNWDA